MNIFFKIVKFRETIKTSSLLNSYNKVNSRWIRCFKSRIKPRSPALQADALTSEPRGQTPRTIAYPAPLSMGFSKQEYWGGLPFPSPMHESEKWKWKVKVKSLSRVWLFVTPWTAAHQAPPSMGFSRQEYWSGLPFPSQEDLPDPGIETNCPLLPLSFRSMPRMVYL